MPENFFRLRVSGLPREQEDQITEAFFEAGAAGVSEDLKFAQLDLRYEPDIVEGPQIDMNVFFTSAPDEGTILKLQSRFPEAKYEMFSEENKDWLEEWKKGFKPFVFAGPFWVVPSWLKPPPEAAHDPSKIIYVEPGMAFGTGTHETTRLAAQLILEEVVRSKAESLVDIGTGTGILALIAYRMGVKKLVGTDIDPEARRTGRENLERNNASSILIPDYNLEDITEQFDIVVANIIDGVLSVLAPDLNRVLKPGGRMILSGVFFEREKTFYDSFTQATGLKLVRKISENEWSAAILEKPVGASA